MQYKWVRSGDYWQLIHKGKIIGCVVGNGRKDWLMYTIVVNGTLQPGRYNTLSKAKRKVEELCNGKN